MIFYVNNIFPFTNRLSFTHIWHSVNFISHHIFRVSLLINSCVYRLCARHIKSSWNILAIAGIMRIYLCTLTHTSVRLWLKENCLQLLSWNLGISWILNQPSMYNICLCDDNTKRRIYKRRKLLSCSLRFLQYLSEHNQIFASIIR